MIENISIYLRIFGIRNFITLFLLFFIFSIFIETSIGMFIGTLDLFDEMMYPSIFRSGNNVVISSYSIAPFTSSIDPNKITSLLNSINTNYNDIKYEVLTIVELGHDYVLLRGLDNKDIDFLMRKYNMSTGKNISNCMNCVWIGVKIASKYRLKAGDTIKIYSPFSSSEYILVINGIINTNSIIDNEIITNIKLARIIRGFNHRVVSAIIISFEDENTRNYFLKKLNISSNFLEKAIIAVQYSKKKISFEAYSTISGMFLRKVGISREIIYAAVILIIIVVSIGLVIAGKYIGITAYNNIITLRYIGVSNTTILLSKIILTSLTLLISSSMNIVILSLGLLVINDPFFHYEIRLEPDFVSLLIMYLSMLLLIVYGELQGVTERNV